MPMLKEAKNRLRKAQAKCKAISVVHAGKTDADYLFREKMLASAKLLVALVDYELAEGD